MKTEKITVDLCSLECGFAIDLDAVEGVEEQTETGQGYLCNKGTPARCVPGVGLCRHKPNRFAELGLAIAVTVAPSNQIPPSGSPSD